MAIVFIGGLALLVALRVPWKRMNQGSQPRELFVIETATNWAYVPDSVVFLAFAPDGTTFTSFNADGTIRLWDVASGGLRSTFQGKGGGPVRSGVTSPDGRFAATVHEDGTIGLWDLASAKQKAILKTFLNRISSLALTGDGAVVVSETEGSRVQVFELASGRVLSTLNDQGRNPVSALALSPDSTTLALAQGGVAIRLCNVATGKVLATLEGHREWINRLAFSPDGRMLASQSSDRTAKVWNLESKECRATFPCAPRGLAWSGDSKRVAAIDNDGTVRLCDGSSGRELARMGDVPLDNGCLALSPDGERLALGGSETRLHFWDVGTGKERARARHAGFIRTAALTANGQILAVQFWNLYSDVFYVKLYEVATGKELPAPTGHSWTGVPSFSADGKTLATGDSEGVVSLWDVTTGEERTRFHWPTNSRILATALTADGKRVGAAAINEVRFWHLPNGSKRTVPRIETLGESAFCLALTPDGNTLATLADFRDVAVWDVPTGKNRSRPDWGQGILRSLAITPDGNTVAAGGDEGVIGLWNSTTGNLLTTLQGHTAVVQYLRFSPDGKTLSSLSADGFMKQWEVATGKEESSMRINDNGSAPGVQRFFIGDDKTMISQEHAGVLRLWDVSGQ